MASRILDHARVCGSLDVYIIGDGWGWVVVEGVELDERGALDSQHRLAGQRFYVEAEARAEFERRTDPPSPGLGADP